MSGQHPSTNASQPDATYALSSDTAVREPPIPARSGYIPMPAPSANEATSEPPPHDTPPQFKSPAAQQHWAATARVTRDSLYVENARSFAPHVVGPVPGSHFIKKLMTPRAHPDLHSLHKSGDKVFAFPGTKAMTEKILVRLVKQHSKAFNGLELRDTHSEPFTTTHLGECRAPDVTVYLEGVRVSPGELKPKRSYNPYQDPESMDNRSTHVFMKDAEQAMHAAGQLQAYASAYFEMQPRTHLFSFAVFGRYARLFRWDRGGCIASEEFRVDKTPYLYQFFRGLGYMSPEERGHDPSVSFDVTDEEAEWASEILAAAGATERELDRNHFRRVHYPDDETHEMREFIATIPRYFSETVEGPCTRGGLAVLVAEEAKDRRIAYLKDTNRYDDSDEDSQFMKEGDTYRLLHEKKVRNIPEHLCSGDATGEYQLTLTDSFVADYACSGVTVFRRRRCYNALGTVGDPLEKYASACQLVEVICDAIAAHQDAYEKAGLLHRDISPGNIIIVTDADGCVTGMLIDWQFAKMMGKHRQPRSHWRVGAWQFHSFRLHNAVHQVRVVHELRDDLESFVYVLAYMIVRYRPITLDVASTLLLFHTTFDEATFFAVKNGRQIYEGGVKKLGFLHQDPKSFGHMPLYDRRIPYCLRSVLCGLQAIFAPLYPLTTRRADHRTEDDAADRNARRFREPDPGWFDGCLKSADRKRRHQEWKEHLRMEAEAERLRAAAAPVSATPVVAPPIDEEPVRSHRAVLKVFTDALEYADSEDTEWKHFDEPPHDQLPELAAKLHEIYPHGILPHPLNAATVHTPRPSQISAGMAPSPRTSQKRPLPWKAPTTSGAKRLRTHDSASSAASESDEPAVLPPARDMYALGRRMSAARRLRMYPSTSSAASEGGESPVLAAPGDLHHVQDMQTETVAAALTDARSRDALRAFLEKSIVPAEQQVEEDEDTYSEASAYDGEDRDFDDRDEYQP